MILILIYKIEYESFSFNKRNKTRSHLQSGKLLLLHYFSVENLVYFRQKECSDFANRERNIQDVSPNVKRFYVVSLPLKTKRAGVD